MRHLREELEEKVRVAQESEAQAKVEETFLTNRVAQLNSDIEKMRGQVQSADDRAAAANAKVETAEAQVAAFEKEMEEMAIEAVYLVWSYNRSVDLSLLGDPSIVARFETKLAAEESAKAQAQLVVSEGRVPEADPVVVMEVDVPLETSEIVKA